MRKLRILSKSYVYCKKCKGHMNHSGMFKRSNFYETSYKIRHFRDLKITSNLRCIQGGKSETPVLQRTPCTPRRQDNKVSKRFGNFKSTNHLCYGILVGVQSAQVYLTIKPKYFTILLIFKRMK